MGTMGVIFFLIICLLFRLFLSWWIIPFRAYSRLKKNGLCGPSPSFPLGNLTEMMKTTNESCSSNENISHDIHSILFPYFARWQQSHGKVFVYWLGTQPFVYIADAVLLKKLSTEVASKHWGKPAVFKRDRDPMFGNGLVMSEGDEWARHRHVLTPAFHPANLKEMATVMVETTVGMIDKWTSQLTNSSNQDIDVEKAIRKMAGEIIAKVTFGVSDRHVFEKFNALRISLFKTKRLLGVPFGEYFLYPKQALEARRLGREINRLFYPIIAARKESIRSGTSPAQHDLLGNLLTRETDDHEQGRLTEALTTEQLVDECKAFFFAGHETMALWITWTMLLLAVNQEWQRRLREEIKEVVGYKEIDVNMLAGLKKMGWVMSEVLRLYPSAPNAQRQTKHDIQVSEDLTIPSGTSMWIDIVAMHHDPLLWGEDVNEFKPERFKDDIHGGCKHKMGYLPFGFGGRMCIGRSLSIMVYKIVLTLILSRFSFTISPTYCHCPSIMLSTMPTHGLPLLLHTLD